MYTSSKTYTHAQGLSCAFRQWRATHSHCSKVHGYAIEVKIVFQAHNLDNCRWVMDFGGLKEVKAFLEKTFDHKTIIASDDPALKYFQQGHELGVLDLVVLPKVGCESFAEYISGYLTDVFLKDNGTRVTVKYVEVKEHESNSARYYPEQ